MPETEVPRPIPTRRELIPIVRRHLADAVESIEKRDRILQDMRRGPTARNWADFMAAEADFADSMRKAIAFAERIVELYGEETVNPSSHPAPTAIVVEYPAASSETGPSVFISRLPAPDPPGVGALLRKIAAVFRHTLWG